MLTVSFRENRSRTSANKRNRKRTIIVLSSINTLGDRKKVKWGEGGVFGMKLNEYSRRRRIRVSGGGLHRHRVGEVVRPHVEHGILK